MLHVRIPEKLEFKQGVIPTFLQTNGKKHFAKDTRRCQLSHALRPTGSTLSKTSYVTSYRPLGIILPRTSQDIL